MSKLENAVHEIYAIDEMAAGDRWLNRIHPMVKFLLTIFYTVSLVSLDKYDIVGMAGMGICLFVLFEVGEVSVRDGVRRLRLLLPFLCIVGIFNPVFDRQVIFMLGQISVTGGMLSMVTMIGKGVLSVFAAYLLIVTTGMDKICRAMRLLHIPMTFVTVIQLIYRYLTLLLAEADKISTAYALRAPGQKGIHYKVWGPLLGQLLLRSMDRGQEVYESMCLRGYGKALFDSGRLPFTKNDGVFAVMVILILAVFRFVPIFDMLGNLFL